MMLLRQSLQFCGMALLLLTCWAGCGDTHTAAMEKDMDEICWTLQDTLELSYPSPDTSKVYSLQFPITFTEDYPYSNIYLRAAVVSPSGDQNLLPARFDLMNAEGEWNGEKSGNEIPLQLGIADGLRFNQQGTYRIRLYHFMRDERLCGIASVGIALDEMVEK